MNYGIYFSDELQKQGGLSAAKGSLLQLLRSGRVKDLNSTIDASLLATRKIPASASKIDQYVDPLLIKSRARQAYLDFKRSPGVTQFDKKVAYEKLKNMHGKGGEAFYGSQTAAAPVILPARTHMRPTGMAPGGGRQDIREAAARLQELMSQPKGPKPWLQEQAIQKQRNFLEDLISSM